MTLDINKAASPYYYYMKFIKENCRPDGRHLHETREFSVDVGSITSANGSALVRYGSTIVLCGIKAHLAKPRDDRPDRGFIVPNVDLPPLCSSSFKTSHTSNEQSHMLTQLMYDIICESKCLNERDLCIQESKLCWCLYIDLICLNYDGNLRDVCCMAMICALKNTKLHDIYYDLDSNKPTHRLPLTFIPLKLHSEPICTTLFLLSNHNILVCDPNREEEEEFAQSCITLCTLNDKHLCLMRIHGGTQFNKDKINLCFQRALDNGTCVRKKLENYFNYK